jgi:hypothetical protein
MPQGQEITDEVFARRIKTMVQAITWNFDQLASQTTLNRFMRMTLSKDLWEAWKNLEGSFEIISMCFQDKEPEDAKEE